jgi:hypothetical protein
LYLHGKNGGKILIGYTFRVGYTYRADCIYAPDRDFQGEIKVKLASFEVCQVLIRPEINVKADSRSGKNHSDPQHCSVGFFYLKKV